MILVFRWLFHRQATCEVHSWISKSCRLDVSTDMYLWWWNHFKLKVSLCDRVNTAQGFFFTYVEHTETFNYVLWRLLLWISVSVATIISTLTQSTVGRHLFFMDSSWNFQLCVDSSLGLSMYVLFFSISSKALLILFNTASSCIGGWCVYAISSVNFRYRHRH